MRKSPPVLSFLLLALTFSPGIGPQPAALAVPIEAYWTGSVSNLWNDFDGANSNFNFDATSGRNAQSIPGGITTVYFSTTYPFRAHLDTQLGSDTAVKGVTVLSTQATPVSIGGSNTLWLGSGGLDLQSNAGPLSVSANVALFDNQTWTNASLFAPLTVTGAITGDGNLTLHGNITLSGANNFTGNLAITAGIVHVAGTINGALSVSDAMFSPGARPGTLAVTGDYSQQATSALLIDLAAPAQYDALNIAGAAALDGNLNLSFLNGYLPSPGSSFQVLTYTSHTGTFSSIQAPTAPGYQFIPTYTPTALILTATAIPEPASLTLLATASTLLLLHRRRHPATPARSSPTSFA